MNNTKINWRNAGLAGLVVVVLGLLVYFGGTGSLGLSESQDKNALSGNLSNMQPYSVRYVSM